MSRNTRKDKYASNSEGSSTNNPANFIIDDREKLHQIYSCIKKLESQVHELKVQFSSVQFSFISAPPHEQNNKMLRILCVVKDRVRKKKQQNELTL